MKLNLNLFLLIFHLNLYSSTWKIILLEVPIKRNYISEYCLIYHFRFLLVPSNTAS